MSLIKKRHAKLTTPHAGDTFYCPFGFAPCLPGPERLVALGFRYWMRGRLEGTLMHWEKTWNLFDDALGVTGARAAVSSLSRWVGAIDASCARTIELHPDDCHSFCRNECFAVSIIAACQHNTCPALRACAFALVETSSIDGVVGEAQNFADTMTEFNQVLSPHSIVAAPVTVPATSRRN